jgi:hypothetical protein
MKVPYWDRSELDRIQTQWHNLTGLHSREECNPTNLLLAETFRFWQAAVLHDPDDSLAHQRRGIVF